MNVKTQKSPWYWPKGKVVLLLLLALLPTLAGAYDAEIDEIYYNLNSDTKEAEVTYKGPASYSGFSYSGRVDIPASITYEGIEYSVTSIGYRAFYNCSDLTSLNIPNSVTSIGERAVILCSGLISLTIPNSVTSIGRGAFAYCSGLTSINVDSSNAFYNDGNGSNCIIESSSNSLIAGCQNTVIPNNVTSIGDLAFAECSGLTSLTIPNSVTSIEYCAFQNCFGLTSLTIPNSVTSIGDWAFWGCSGLTSVYVDIETPLEIGSDTFSDRANATLYVPAGCKTAYEEADYWKDFGVIEEMPNSSDPDITEGLVAYYPFNGNANDESGNGYHATPCNNFQYEEGIVGDCISVEGQGYTTSSGGHVMLPQFDFDASSGVTLSLWVKAMGLTSSDGEAYIRFGSDDDSGGLDIFQESELRFRYHETVIYVPYLEDYTGKWMMYTLTCGNDGKLKAYINGVLVGEEDVEYDGQISTSHVALGRHWWWNYSTTSTRFIGSFDEVRIYNRALTAEEVKQLSEIGLSSTTDLVTVGSTGYATFCSPHPLDFSDVADVKAYIASGFNPQTGTLVLTRVTEVPAGEGLYLEGTPGEYNIPQKETSMFYSNLLKGVTTDTTISPTEGDKTNFILANGIHGIGFYTLSSEGELAAGKAYLQLPTASVAGVKYLKLYFDEDGETGIAEVEKPDTAKEFYNLQGQRVSQPRQGLYITNGKKVLMK